MHGLFFEGIRHISENNVQIYLWNSRHCCFRQKMVKITISVTAGPLYSGGLRLESGGHPRGQACTTSFKVFSGATQCFEGISLLQNHAPRPVLPSKHGGCPPPVADLADIFESPVVLNSGRPEGTPEDQFDR